jgi:hypothetical protein
MSEKLKGWPLSLATIIIKDVASMISSINMDEARSNLLQAQKHITELGNEISIKVKFSDEGSCLSGDIHTWIRKCDDSPAGTILYRMIQRGRGLNVWAAFCNKLAETRKLEDAHLEAKMVAEGSDEAGIDMELAIRAWEGIKEYLEQQ